MGITELWAHYIPNERTPWSWLILKTLCDRSGPLYYSGNGCSVQFQHGIRAMPSIANYYVKEMAFNYEMYCPMTIYLLLVAAWAANEYVYGKYKWLTVTLKPFLNLLGHLRPSWASEVTIFSDQGKSSPSWFPHELGVVTPTQILQENEAERNVKFNKLWVHWVG